MLQSKSLNMTMTQQPMVNKCLGIPKLWIHTDMEAVQSKPQPVLEAKVSQGASWMRWDLSDLHTGLTVT